MASPGTNEIRRLKALKKANALKTPQVPQEKVVVEPVISKVVPVAASLPEEPPVETVDYSSMTKSQLQDLLKERGVAYLPRSTNRILIGLLENV